MESLLAAALRHDRDGDAAQNDDDNAVASVAITVTPDESDPIAPRIRFEAAVLRDSTFDGTPSLRVRFVSNVAFGDAPPSRPRGFVSGVHFED